MRRPVSPGWLFAPLSAALLALLTAGCGHDHPSNSTEVDEYFYDCEDTKRPPALTVFATDESLRKLIEKEDAKAIVTRDEEAATLTAPPSGAALSASTPPTFLLSPPATGAQLDQRPAPPRFTPAPGRGWLRRALAWLAPIATAHAHCLPVTGDNYLVRLTREGGTEKAYAALVSMTSFTPGLEAWKKAMSGRAGQTLRLTLIRAGYSAGTITSGPFVGTKAVTFTVAP